MNVSCEDEDRNGWMVPCWKHYKNSQRREVREECGKKRDRWKLYYCLVGLCRNWDSDTDDSGLPASEYSRSKCLCSMGCGGGYVGRHKVNDSRW